MDLVDIDKVLDDFELDEIKNFVQDSSMSKTSSLAKVASEKTKNNDLRSNKITNNTLPILKTQKNPGNVTNVFNFLNEYVNVDIETNASKTKDHIRSNEKSMESIQENTKENKEILVDSENFKATQHLWKSEDKIFYNSDGENRNSNDCNDLSGDEQDGEEILVSNSSITTSSPSSFSSGPSPGSCSSSSNLCSLISKQDSIMNQELPNEKFSLTSHDIDRNHSEEENKSDIELSKENNINDICVSNISLSEGYHDNKLSSSSIGDTSDDFINNSDLPSSILSFKTKCLENETYTGLSNNENNTKVSEETFNEHISNQQNNTNDDQAIKFGSTMDEISDTELDSLLHGIDNDSTEIDPPAAISMDDIEENCVKLKTEPKESKPAMASIKVASSNENDDILQNADSFSQASTIELVETKLQTDFDNDISATSCGSFDCKSNGSTKSTSKCLEMGSSIKIEDNHIQNDKSINEGSSSNINQRPNSLNLVTKIALDISSTAGQTPPALQIKDITSKCSTSSSEEISQIAANNEISSSSNGSEEVNSWISESNSNVNNNNPESQLGKVPPFWIPDNDKNSCMQCQQKFSMIKRRHHCRACGQLLCSLCCSQKAKLQFLENAEVRVCVQCHLILNERSNETINNIRSSGNVSTQETTTNNRIPNPNNPMEYCSTIPPHQQISSNNCSPISVMVPVGVLKREGSTKQARKDKNVIFSDGIRPGCDLTDLDNNWNESNSLTLKSTKIDKQVFQSLTGGWTESIQRASVLRKASLPVINKENGSYIPKGEKSLPPIYILSKSGFEYKDVENNEQLLLRLRNETLKFAVQRNFYVYTKVADLKCCINKLVINFTTKGMHHVGQDEIVILLEMDSLYMIPKDIFTHLNNLYNEADKGQPVGELGFSMADKQNFLGWKENGGFLYIRQTFQCMQGIIVPDAPYLIGLLIHRWEVPWAKVFPLRLMLRLGAQYRYYPCPHVSIQGRNSVYAEIAQTIINFLADFRNYTYTIGTIKGMYIHMEDRKTTVLIPRNRLDQVIKALNNSSEHILALGGNFSKKADGHLVCIQNMQSDCPETHTYSTQAINIQGQPRKVTGASFLVLNGALKSSSGLSGKCNIVEDGLMVQIPPNKMSEIRNSLKSMKDINIICGVVDADETQTEMVKILWTENDTEFNIGVTSPIDKKKMDGIPSMRVHLGTNYSNANYIIRWTEVFIISSGTDSAHGKDPVDISKISEQIAKAASTALVSFLDLLVANECFKIGLRVTIRQDNVSYEAGSKSSKLPPLYMNALDRELIPALHGQASLLDVETHILLEFIFYILNK